MDQLRRRRQRLEVDGQYPATWPGRRLFGQPRLRPRIHQDGRRRCAAIGGSDPGRGRRLRQRVTHRALPRPDRSARSARHPFDGERCALLKLRRAVGEERSVLGRGRRRQSLVACRACGVGGTCRVHCRRDGSSGRAHRRRWAGADQAAAGNAGPAPGVPGFRDGRGCHNDDGDSASTPYMLCPYPSDRYWALLGTLRSPAPSRRSRICRDDGRRASAFPTSTPIPASTVST